MFQGSTVDALKHAADTGKLNDFLMALASSGEFVYGPAYSCETRLCLNEV